jgi:protein TonB
MSNIKVLRDPGYGLGKEAIRVLKSLKSKWTPGMIAGQAVRTSYNLPITVKLE